MINWTKARGRVFLIWWGSLWRWWGHHRELFGSWVLMVRWSSVTLLVTRTFKPWYGYWGFCKFDTGYIASNLTWTYFIVRNQRDWSQERPLLYNILQVCFGKRFVKCFFFTYAKINGFFLTYAKIIFFYICKSQCFFTYAKINVFNLNVWNCWLRNFTVRIHVCFKEVYFLVHL